MCWLLLVSPVFMIVLYCVWYIFVLDPLGRTNPEMKFIGLLISILTGLVWFIAVPTFAIVLSIFWAGKYCLSVLELKLDKTAKYVDALKQKMKEVNND